MRGIGKQQGFTLIELAIVLVVIGLVVGGVLVGQDLTRAAGERSQITQIEKYNQAVNAFKSKYGALPGDIDAGSAAKFGFTTRAGSQGQGDGNGVIEAQWWGYSYVPSGVGIGNGENALFWLDLTYANGQNVNLIEGSFSKLNQGGCDIYAVPAGCNITFEDMMPEAKLGGGIFVYVYSYNGVNYFGLSQPTQIASIGTLQSNPIIPVRTAYDIDKKIDDGLPQSGNVTALYIDWIGFWSIPVYAEGGSTAPWNNTGPFDTSATAGSTITCFDNGNVGGAIQNYSIEINQGNGRNCALSFKFQ